MNRGWARLCRAPTTARCGLRAGRACLRQAGLRDPLRAWGGYTITNAYDYWDGVVYPAGALGIKHGLRYVIRRNDYEFQAGGSYYWG